MEEDDSSQLESELKELEMKYSNMQKDYDAKIAQIQSEVEESRTNLSKGDSIISKNALKYFDIVYNLKRTSMEKVNALEHQHRINVSQLKLEVAEKNREISTQQSKNAQLFIQNLNSQRTIEDLTLKIEKMQNEVQNSKVSIQKYIDSMKKKEISFHDNILEKITEISERIPKCSKNIRQLHHKIDHIDEDNDKFSEIYQQYIYCIDHLVRSICFLTDSPMDSCPDVQRLIDSPKFLEKFIVECEEKLISYDKETRLKLTKSTDSLSRLLKVKNSEINIPLATVLSNLGAVSLDVVEGLSLIHI